jgi:BarA-like signal transduction histidine kinase
MQEIKIHLSEEKLQKIKRKLSILTPVSNTNLVQFAITEFLKKQSIQ